MEDWAPATKPGYLVNRASRLFARIGEARLRVLDLGVAYLPVFAALGGGAALSQRDLAAHAQIEQPTMAQLLARMDRAGLLVRTPDPADKRSSLISLSPLARSKIDPGRAVLMQGNAEALAGFSPEEEATLRALLERLIRNLEAVKP